MTTPLTITVEELKARREAGENPEILDVREPDEFQIANLGGRLVPLRELMARHEELDPSKEWIVLCHHGMRSGQAVRFLRTVGFEHARNLTGGIDRYSRVVDPTIPVY